MGAMPTLHDLARNQLGLLTRTQVRALGLPLEAWHRGCRDGRLEVVLPGVARVEGFQSPPEQEILAGVLLGGHGALASHRSALQLWGCPMPALDVDVMVAGRSRPRSRPGVTFHRTRDRLDLEPSRPRGVPCTSPLRALVDVGELDEHLVEAALGHLAVSRLVVPSVARAVADRHTAPGRAGAAALRRACERWPPRIERPDSVLEVEVARALVGAGLGEHHPVICGFEVDFAYRQGLVLETDGWEHHGTRQAFEEDRRRDATLVAAGWRVIRVTWRQFHADPDRVIDQVRRARDPV
jgi:very-short-patch-repair endonuclease